MVITLIQPPIANGISVSVNQSSRVHTNLSVGTVSVIDCVGVSLYIDLVWLWFSVCSRSC
jgi:hypothetical protein